MMQCQNFRVSISGYNKQDVDQCLDNLDVQMESKDQEIAHYKQQCIQLEEANAVLQGENAEMNTQLQAYASRKDALIQLELDAQLRATQRQAETDALMQSKMEALDAQLAEKEAATQAQLTEIDAAFAEKTAAAQAEFEAFLADLKAQRIAHSATMAGTIQETSLLQQEIAALSIQLGDISQTIQSKLDSFQTTANCPAADPTPQEPAQPEEKTVADMYAEIVAEET